MSDSQYAVVERPAGRRSSSNALYEAIVGTAVSGQALRIPLNGLPVPRLRNRWTVALRARGYEVHVHQSPDREALIVWAAKKETA